MQSADRHIQALRRIFCIRSGKVHTPSSNVPQSHSSWFKEEGWMNEHNADTFFETTERGYYLPENNILYTYIGKDFSFTEKTISNLKLVLSDLQEVFEVNQDTKICFGPKDMFFNDREHKQLCIGTLGDIQDSR
jgi:hypothetical protein